MQLRTIKPINFLFFRTETTVAELSNYLTVGQQLIREAVKYNLMVFGPVHWHYFGFDGDESKKFTLEIALPVNDVVSEYDGEYHFKRSEEFKCVTTTHEGNWMDIPAAYGRLMQFISENKLQPTAINREIYVNVDLKNPEANIAEIQMGVK